MKLDHFPGYYESRQSVLQMTDYELLCLLDELSGRGNLTAPYDHDELLQEALRQHSRDWACEPEWGKP